MEEKGFKVLFYGDLEKLKLSKGYGYYLGKEYVIVLYHTFEKNKILCNKLSYDKTFTDYSCDCLFCKDSHPMVSGRLYDLLVYKQEGEKLYVDSKVVAWLSEHEYHKLKTTSNESWEKYLLNNKKHIIDSYTSYEKGRKILLKSIEYV